MFVYKVDVMERLKKKGYTRKELQEVHKIGNSQFDKIYAGEVVGIKVLDKLCTLLECQPGTLIKHVPDGKTTKK